MDGLSWGTDDRSVRFPVCDGFVQVDRGDRFLVESHLWNDRRHAAAYLFDLSDRWLDRPQLLRYGVVNRRNRLYRCFKWRDNFTGSEDRVPGGFDAETTADCDSCRRPCFGAGFRTNPFEVKRECNGLCAAGFV